MASNSFAASSSNSAAEENDPTLAFDVKIQNVVCTIDFGIELDLITIASKISRAEHNPSRFPAVIIKMIVPRATALIFKSGKVVITGTKTKRDSYLGAQKLARLLQSIGYSDCQARESQMKVRNMTATCSIGIPLSLEGFLYAHVDNSTYEPELFPGLIYKLADPKVVMLIFVSGKIVVTGAKNEDEICHAMQIMGPKLFEFRKKSATQRIQDFER